MKQYKVFRYMILATLGLLVFIAGLLFIKGSHNSLRNDFENQN